MVPRERGGHDKQPRAVGARDQVDFAVPDRDDFTQWVPITIAYPSHGGPGTEAFNIALRQVVHRAMKHEADEGIMIDGERLFDPHR